jgi:hypothetical protein
VDEEAADELAGGECHDLLTITTFGTIILPAEGDAGAVAGDQPAVGNGDAVGIIDREFNSVCRAVWAYTLDDFDDDCLAKEDHDWLDDLTAQRAYQFAAENGYDLGDYANGEIVSDWWGFTWMILAEKRGLLTPEQRALAWKKHDDRLLVREKIVAVIR